MHTDKAFADVLVKFGSLAEVAAKRLLINEEEKMSKIRSNRQALARFFWFTAELGLMREKENVCVYGSGLLSSADEIEHSIRAKEVQRHPFQLEWVINQSFEYDRFQPLLFIVESFEYLTKKSSHLKNGF
jgi:phenylalanine-4-hydroxylase